MWRRGDAWERPAAVSRDRPSPPHAPWPPRGPSSASGAPRVRGRLSPAVFACLLARGLRSGRPAPAWLMPVEGTDTAPRVRESFFRCGKPKNSGEEPGRCRFTTYQQRVF
ncbi:hypothetical protein GCM10010116_09780 [Microbispora rosea subsp. aerata]|nr:hypothetical protein GCM10010116_09780 [Microbispora rosea subsp. aerata]GIH56244.1 hypothetical protein Mro02_31580 [Microbispora rosea subsp. aerata]GLJ82316.1 hypothetical protein GCM10017588_10410 [Microbispora rosea subsp. aerata]